MLAHCTGCVQLRPPCARRALLTARRTPASLWPVTHSCHGAARQSPAAGAPWPWPQPHAGEGRGGGGSPGRG
eukprot:6390220-Lingulodinium_polyedra.AAC.1